MVLVEYAKRIVLFEEEGYRPLTIAKMLESEGIFVSRRGVAKFLLRVESYRFEHDNRSSVHFAT